MQAGHATRHDFDCERRLERRDGRGDHRGHRARRSPEPASRCGSRRTTATRSLAPGFNAGGDRRVHDRRGGHRQPARPANRVGWAMLAGGLLWSLGGAPSTSPSTASSPIPAAFRGLSVRGHRLGARGLGMDDRHVGGARACFPTESSVKRVGSGSRRPRLIAVGSVLDPLFDPQAGLRGLGAGRTRRARGSVASDRRPTRSCIHVPSASPRRSAWSHCSCIGGARGTPLQRQQPRCCRRAQPADRRRADRAGRHRGRVDLGSRGLAAAVRDRVRRPGPRPL